MPRLTQDQVSLFEATYNRIRLAPDWDQCDEKTTGSKLKNAFREDFMKGRPAHAWDEFAARPASWWRRAIYLLELPKTQCE